MILSMHLLSRKQFKVFDALPTKLKRNKKKIQNEPMERD